MEASEFLAQVREATSFETRGELPVRVIDGEGQTFDVFSVIASTQHGGELRICVEPVKEK